MSGPSRVRTLPVPRAALLAAATLLGCDPAEDKLPLDEAREALVDGTKTYVRPEVGKLVIGSKTCTGTLVANNAVVTAARCVGFGTQAVTGNYGKFTIETSATVRRDFVVDRYKSFGDGSTRRDDLAILRLATRVPTDVAKPVKIATAAAGSGELVAMYGYGCTNRTTGANDGVKRRFSFTEGMNTYDLCKSDTGAGVFRGSGTPGTGMLYRVGSGWSSGYETADRFADPVYHRAALVSQIGSWSGAAGAGPACGEWANTQIWTCAQGTEDRVRCKNGQLERVTCALECQSRPTGVDDVCGSITRESTTCGDAAGYTLWTCADGETLETCYDGDRYASTCEFGCSEQPAGVNDTCDKTPGGSADLQAVMDKLGAKCEQYSPGTTCGLAVRDLVTGERAAWRGDRKIVSASSAKNIWIAVGLQDVGIAAVEPYAWDTFRFSSDYAPAYVMDMLSSYNRVNTFMWNEAGMPNSAFCNWHDGRHATNCPGALGADNYFTANDTVEFMARLWKGTLLNSSAKRTKLLEWMTWSKNSGFAAWIGTQLPAWAQERVRHKPGWLAPENFPGYSVSNEIGIVETPDGGAYAVSTLLTGGSDHYGRQLPMMDYTSCVIYHAVTGDVADPFQPCWLP